MKKAVLILLVGLFAAGITLMPGCQQNCVDNLLLQTTAMNLEVNSANLGVLPGQDRNTTDTIRSHTRQFYNDPEFRRFGWIPGYRKPSFLISSALAAGDCPEQETYISRLDPLKTRFSLSVDYDASAIGLGVLPAGTDLLLQDAVRNTYLSDLLNNPFLLAGAPTPVTLSANFFQPINHQWVTFYFYFEEAGGTPYADSATAYVSLVF